MGVMTYSPLAGGCLSRRWRESVDGLAPTTPARRQRAVLAIGFAKNHPAVIPVISGPRTMDQLESELPLPTWRT
jgi:predicted aldo/keto reductase-like oxidoreductase